MLKPLGCPRLDDSLVEIKATAPAPVSPPMSSRHVLSRRSSSPGLSPRSLDGTSAQLFSFTSSTPSPITNPSPALIPRAVSAPLPEMAIRPIYRGGNSTSEHAVHSAATNGSGRPKDMPPGPDVMDPPPAVQEPVSPLAPLPDLDEVSHLLRQAKYHKQRRLQTQRLFRRLQIATSRTQRLTIASRHVRHTLADCLRSEDKQSFAHLFNTFHNAYDQISTMSSADHQDSEPFSSVKEGHSDQFLDEISSSSRETTLQLLTRLHFDKHFVADRIASLSHRELTALLSDGTPSRRPESVLGGSQRSSTRSAKPLGFVVDRVVDDISANGFRTSLENLVHLHNSAGQGSQAFSRSTDLWAHVASQVISDRKSGGDRLTSALLDIWSHQTDWPGKDRIGTWMLHTLRRGQFLLEQPSRQSFRVRVYGQVDLSAEETARTEAFYTESVNQLLELLSDPNGASVIPEAALDLTSAIYRSLDGRPDHQKDLPSFVATRWLFGSFLMDLLVLPESHGLLNGHYIPDPARLKILGEVATRSKKVVFDVVYAWKNGSVLSAEVVDRVQRIIKRFDWSTTQRVSSNASSDAKSGPNSSDSFLAVSAVDIVNAMNALFPSRRPVSVSSDHDTLRSGLQSSASSVSGFSLFRTTDPVSTVWTPSATPFSRPTALYEHPHGNVPFLEHGPSMEAEVMDARSELEEYIASHGTIDDNQWALLVIVDGSQQVECYGRILGREPPANVWPARQPFSIACAKLPSSGRVALESLLSSAPQGISSDRTIDLPEAEDALTLSERILTLFDDRIAACENSLDFVASHYWHSYMEMIETFIELHGPQTVVCSLIDAENCAKGSMGASLAVIDRCDEWLSVVLPTLVSASSRLASACDSSKALRAKMWYCVDVRTCSAYDNVRSVVSALRVMGKPKRAGTFKQAHPLRHWSGSRLSSQNVHLKTEAQVLELLATNPGHGGPNKLSDEQARITLNWLRRNEIQLICAGEESIHKFCMEVRKCVEQIANPSHHDNPLLWSNVLFSREPSEVRHSAMKGTRPFGSDPTHRRFDLLSLQPHQPVTIDNLSNASRTLSSTSSRDYFDKSPTLAARSSTAFWSPAATELRSPSSTTSIASYVDRNWEAMPQKPTITSTSPETPVTDNLREQVTGLLLSDVGANLFVHGSETDVSFFTGLGATLTEQHFKSMVSTAHASEPEKDRRLSHPRRTLRNRPVFDFEQAFQSTFELFTVECDPFAKLRRLNHIQRLIRPYMAGRPGVAKSAQTPLDKATSEDLLHSVAGRHVTPESELLIEGFYTLFCQRNIRPSAIFRDLQYIASLVPSSVLDSIPKGQAFWNAAVAAIRLKSEARRRLVETADSIIDYHTNNRGHGRSASTAQQQRDSATFAAPSRTPSAELIAHYTMADAAHLLQITAREGDPAAQRELATLYLTHPELMGHIIAPFALPGDVFKDEIEGRWKRDRDPERCDPSTMCVAHHWMVLGAKGGDSLAREFLRQREEMERLP